MRFIAPLCLYLLLSSCNANSGQSKDLTYTNRQAQDTLSYSYQEIREISPYFIVQDEIVDTAKYEIRYPIFKNEQINNLLREVILIDGEASVKDAAQSFIDSYNEFVEDSSEQLVNTTWFRKTNAQIINNTPLFFTLATKVMEYTGGAHGSHLTFYNNYDARNGKRISLQDFIQKDKYASLVNLAEAKFRKQENIKPDESLAKDFFFENGKFSINDNFGLTKDKLIIYFNEYEIRPYAEGATAIEIPYVELLPLVNIRGKHMIESIK